MTDDQQLQKKQEELELLAAVSNIINCMIVLLDPGGRIVRINETAEITCGFSPPEAKKQHFWDIFCHPEEVDLYKAFFFSIDHRSLPFKIETQMVSHKGEPLDVVWEYNLLGDKNSPGALYVLTGSDITDQKTSINELQRTKEMYRALIHASPVAVISLGPDLQIKSWSSAAENLLGWSEKEVLGQSISRYFVNDASVIHDCCSEALKGKIFYRLEFGCNCKKGATIFAELSIAPLRNINGEVNGLVMVVNDITERKKYEEQLEYLSTHDQLTGLYNRAFFDRLLYDNSWNISYPVTIIAADLDGLKLINDTLGHDRGNQMLVTCANTIKQALRKTDILARVGGDEFAVLLNNTGEDVGQLVIDRIKNSLEVYNQGNSEFPLSVSLGIATLKQSGMTLVDLYREADDLMYIDKLHTGAGAKSQIINSLMAALEERDFITAGHALRLEELCRSVGRQINLSNRQLGRLVLLARVHDLGKVGIPDEILYKKGPLTPGEWKIMRKHPEKGHRIASASPDLHSIADLILKHHERWDGSGYPLGLKGMNIPVECRILAIADAYDAMTNERPYRKAKSLNEAVAELRDCAGTQFDPELVEVFLKVLQERMASENCFDATEKNNCRFHI